MVEFLPAVANLDPTLTDSAPNTAEISRTRPEFGLDRPIFDPVRDCVADVGRIRKKFGRVRANIGPNQENMFLMQECPTDLGSVRERTNLHSHVLSIASPIEDAPERHTQETPSLLSQERTQVA